MTNQAESFKPMTRIASHRGGTLEYGDSTPTAFHNTAALPLDEVEFDLHPSIDGAIMVHHDPTLDRTTDKIGALAMLTEAEIRSARINYSRGEHPISLQELCAIFAPSTVDFRCEFKPGSNGEPYPDFVPRAIKTLRDEGMLDRTGFSAFLISTLDEIACHCTRPRLWLVSPSVQKQLGLAAVIEVARAHDIPEIGLNIDHTEAQIMAEVTAAGIAFGCWGAHDTRQIDKALSLGVKVFTTDRPNLAIALRADYCRKDATTEMAQ
jgi:glycerophosphoryl diester phosphodiesterase